MLVLFNSVSQYPKVYNSSMWFVYVILCEDGSFYTGMAKNVEARFKMHQKGRGARYTKIYKPVKILYSEQFEERIDAIHREIQIKTWSKSRKIKDLGLIISDLS